MKKLKLIGALALIASLSFTSCKKDSTDDNTPTTQTAANGGMIAKIDGKAWTANLTGASQQNGMTNISGQSTDGQTLTITLSDTKAGTYALNGSTMHAAAYTKTQGSSGYSSNGASGAGGTVVISEVDATNKTISGTFSFTLIEPSSGSKVVVSEGSFNKVTYTTCNTTAKKDVHAKVDGQTWDASSVYVTKYNGKIAIAANSSNGTTIGMYIPETATVGTHEIDMFGDYTAQYNKSSSVFLMADSGNITITENNTTTRLLTGTFSFEASEISGSEKASITNGTFSVNY
jgi:hypothetical protein